MSELHGWDSVDSGIELINWSALARGGRNGLNPEIHKDVFDERWTRLDPKYGRWLCWVAFAVGAECIVKGMFEVRECPPKKWKFGCSLPWRELGIPENKVDCISKWVLRLTKLRNRDAHAYIANQRDQNFDELGDFVLALNLALNAVSN